MSPSQASFHPEMLQWLIIPALLIWFSASYLLGVAAQPVWQTRKTPETAQVLAVNTDTPTASSSPVFHWQQTGLVTFWFDDGWLTQYTVAAPLLKEQNFPAAIAITTDLVGYEAYVSWGQIKRLHHSYGWEVSAHSRTHNCDPESFTPENLKNEILGSQQDLIAHNLIPDAYVVPCGVISSDLIQLIKDNYVLLRDTEGGLNPLPVTNPYRVHAYTIHDDVKEVEIDEWLAQAAKDRSWLILMFHQIDTTSSPYSLTPDRLQAIITAVTRSGLPVVLPGQALQIITQ